MQQTIAPTPDIQPLTEYVRALLAATAHIADEKIVAARNRLEEGIESGSNLLADARKKVCAGAGAADQTIRDYPYHAIGVALGIGAVLGLLWGRRS